MSAMTCPSREELSAYVLGRLADQVSEAVAAHLDSCPDCEAALATLDHVDDTLVAQIRRGSTATPYMQEPACRVAVDRARTVLDRLASADDRSNRSLGTLGEYQLLEELGRGGMGRVYKALHTKLDRVVAVKILPHGRMADRQSIDRFEREMKAVGCLAHPNIVHAHDAREIDGAPVLVMEFVEGLDLAEVVRHLGALPVADACELMRQTALALQCAHEHGLIHRDVKPSNVMLTPAGEVKLLDLGLARFHADGSTGIVPAPAGEEMTGTGQAMGTADYMAPEQASDSRTVDIRADLYSLGCTLYKLLSGRAPFSGPKYRTTLDKMNAHVHEPVPAIRGFCPEIPAGLAALLERLLAKSPGDRCAAPAEVAEVLAPWCADADLPALLQRAQASPLPLGERQGEGGQTPQPSPAASQPLPAPWGWRTIVTLTLLLLMVGGLGFALGIMIRIHKDGQETTLEVPAGSNTRVAPDGQVDVTLPGKRPSEPAKAAIEELDLVRVTALDAREPMTWQWQLHLPKGHRYAWCVRMATFPQAAFPQSTFRSTPGNVFPTNRTGKRV